MIYFSHIRGVVLDLARDVLMVFNKPEVCKHNSNIVVDRRLANKMTDNPAIEVDAGNDITELDEMFWCIVCIKQGYKYRMGYRRFVQVSAAKPVGFELAALDKLNVDTNAWYRLWTI